MIQTEIPLNIGPLKRPVITDQVTLQALTPWLKRILPTWDLIPGDPKGPPVDTTTDAEIRLHLGESGFVRTSPWLQQPAIYRHPVDAVCDLIVDLIHAYVRQDTELLCLHSAAIAGVEGLTLFPATYNAGKSLLSSALLANGYRLFSDDVIPLRKADLKGVGLGIPPRLRLPLPEGLDDRLLEFINSRMQSKSDRFGYLSLNEKELAATGEVRPIRHMILLQRQESLDIAAIEEASREQMLKELILRNFAREGAAPKILERLFLLVQESACYSLRYSDPQQAVECIRQLNPPLGTNTGVNEPRRASQ